MREDRGVEIGTGIGLQPLPAPNQHATCKEVDAVATPHLSSRPSKDWASNPLVQKHIHEAAMFIAGWFADSSTRMYSVSRLESPLEVVFELWHFALQRAGQASEDVELERQADVTTSAGRKYRLDYRFLPVNPLRYRAEKVGIPIPKIAVELDGHDFHERTKEQVAHRNQRDRDLQLDGWLVLHFSGSELNRDPASTVLEASNAAYQAMALWDFECAVDDREKELAANGENPDH